MNDMHMLYDPFLEKMLAIGSKDEIKTMALQLMENLKYRAELMSKMKGIPIEDFDELGD